MKLMNYLLIFFIILTFFPGCDKKDSSKSDQPVTIPSEQIVKIQGIVIDKYIFDNDYRIVVKTKADEKIVLHGKAFYEKYKIGDEVNLSFGDSQKE